MTAPHPSEEMLQRLAEGTLRGRAGAQIAEHLDACARCMSIHGQYEQLFAELNSQPVVFPPPEVSRRAMEAVRAEAEWRRLAPRFWPLWAACVAACVAAVCLFTKPETLALPQSTYAEVEELVGEITTAWRAYATWVSTEMTSDLTNSVSAVTGAVESAAQNGADGVLWWVCGLSALCLMAHTFMRMETAAPRNAMRNVG